MNGICARRQRRGHGSDSFAQVFPVHASSAQFPAIAPSLRMTRNPPATAHPTERPDPNSPRPGVSATALT